MWGLTSLGTGDILLLTLIYLSRFEPSEGEMGLVSSAFLLRRCS